MEKTLTFSGKAHRILACKRKSWEIIEVPKSGLSLIEGTTFRGSDIYQGKRTDLIRMVVGPVLFVDSLDLIVQFIRLNFAKEKNASLQKIFIDWVNTDCYVFAKR